MNPSERRSSIGRLSSGNGDEEGSKRAFGQVPLILLLTLLLPGISCRSQVQPHKETRFMMGTLVEMVLYGDDEASARAADLAFDRMREIEDLAHPNGEASPLSGIRQGKGGRVTGDLGKILDIGMAVSRATSGAFDPTLGELVYLWGFGRDDPRLPDPDQIRRALSRAGYRKVPDGECCPEGQGIWFDLGGVAKGYAVDEAVRILRESGVPAGIVNAGGDLRSFGTRPGRGYWKIGVQDPEDPQGLAGVLELREMAVATSGDYQRYFLKDGVRYHHILNPETGYPARSGLRGTTVIAPDCATADAVATAAFVMGPDRALSMLEGRPGVEGVLITDAGDVITTSGIGEGGIGFEKR